MSKRQMNSADAAWLHMERPTNPPGTYRPLRGRPASKQGERRLVTRALVSILLLGLVVLIAACGGSVSVNSKGQVAVGPKTLRVGSLPFTFRYPASLQEATEASLQAAHAVALVGVPGENSYIAVHLNGETAMSLDALEAQAHRALGASALDTRRVSHAGIPMVAITTRVAAAPGLHTTLYGFSAGGRTWLIECRSSAGNSQSMKQWCAQALDSLRLGR
ncbi:MAG TPA: hypothetical protein VII01_09990 [Solirubrobacteraceae bacterium]